MKHHFLQSGSALAHWRWRPYEPRKTLGEQVRAMRQAKGMTQRDLAERSGLTQGAISRFERYDWSNWSFELACDILHGLGARMNVELTPWEDVRAQHGPAF